jgi:TRAP-type C4-dicarboxylate transport system substrate-binding protein
MTVSRSMRNLLLFLVAAGLAAGCGTDQSDPPVEGFGNQITLTFGHPYPPTDPIQVNVWEPWVEEVRERTGGTVNIEIYAGGALGPGASIYELVAGGAQDFGWTMPGYTPGRFPVSQIIEAPFMFENAQQATEVAGTLWEEFDDFRREYEDVRPLTIWAMDTGDLFTRSQPVRRLEDLAGLTIRAPSPLQNEALKALGASPVSLPGPQIYDSVERGVIDGYKLANSATRVFDLGRATRYRTVCNCYTGLFVFVMNPRAWDRLSPAQQQVLVESAGPDLGMRLANEHQAMADEVAREYWPTVGVETITLSEDEFARWRDAVGPVFEQWVQEREAADIPGRMMADRMFELTGTNR